MTEYYSRVHACVCVCPCASHLHLFICGCSLRLYPYLDYCEQCCYAQWAACIFLSEWFFRTQTFRLVRFVSQPFKCLTTLSAYIVWVRSSWVCSFKGKVLFSSSFFQDFSPHLWFSAGCKRDAWLYFFFFHSCSFYPAWLSRSPGLTAWCLTLTWGDSQSLLLQVSPGPSSPGLVGVSLFFSLFSFWPSLCACF